MSGPHEEQTVGYREIKLSYEAWIEVSSDGGTDITLPGGEVATGALVAGADVDGALVTWAQQSNLLSPG
ncbi:hypothetical protein ON010_g8074 [Phytophthora cinnamomi]|nr:hypothetical protein ON010_g8074 [Phytophthora cinnamomi]